MPLTRISAKNGGFQRVRPSTTPSPRSSPHQCPHPPATLRPEREGGMHLGCVRLTKTGPWLSASGFLRVRPQPDIPATEPLPHVLLPKPYASPCGPLVLQRNRRPGRDARGPHPFSPPCPTRESPAALLGFFQFSKVQRLVTDLHSEFPQPGLVCPADRNPGLTQALPPPPAGRAGLWLELGCPRIYHNLWLP